ncbi:unnamed protein product [Candida verbasci]|uniref:HhH-GPD domain-containing protein n=1 Tax=Candida verbasci TaxID=1227364 RepID=A0A9W4XGN2_9ASCO|nr:unnamed protein product [Candida verbasci]
MVAKTRSSKSITPIEDEIMDVKPIITNSKIKKPKLVAKVKPKLIKSHSDLEDLLTHIAIPKDLALPQEYINYHTSDFIEGIRHILKVDPSLYPVIVHSNFERFNINKVAKNNALIHDYWYNLVSSVIAQQISGSAAKSIESKFKQLFQDEIPTPAKTLSFTHEELRSVGFSNSKVKYVMDISEAFNDPSHKLTNINFYQDSRIEDIILELCKLKGIGPWSAKMFAIFTLEKMNVFAEDDLGIARGMARYLKIRPEYFKLIKNESANHEPTQLLLKRKTKFASKENSKRNWIPIHDAYVKYIAEKFSPYKTVFMMILWRLSSTNIDVLSKLDE